MTRRTHAEATSLRNIFKGRRGRLFARPRSVSSGGSRLILGVSRGCGPRIIAGLPVTNERVAQERIIAVPAVPFSFRSPFFRRGPPSHHLFSPTPTDWHGQYDPRGPAWTLQSGRVILRLCRGCLSLVPFSLRDPSRQHAFVRESFPADSRRGARRLHRCRARY